MIIDAEVHLVSPELLKPKNDFKDEPYFNAKIFSHKSAQPVLAMATIESALESMRKSRIDKSVIMGLPFLKDERNMEGNKYIYKACKDHPDKFIGLGILNPGKKDFVRKEIKKFKDEYGFVGVKVIASWQDFSLNDKVFYRTVEEIIKNDLILFPHIDFMTTGSTQDSPHHLLNLAKKFPELKILAPHLGGLLCLHHLFEPYRKYFKNMRFVTSVSETMKFVEFAAQAVEDHQLVFGTDYPFQPVHDQVTVLKRFKDLNIKKEVKDKIYSKNLLDFLGR